MTERNVTIDIAKGIGIILVVLGHNWIITHDHGELFRIVFSFHLPLFFFLSGVVLHPDVEFKTFLVSRADALLKPFFVVLVVWGLARIALSGIDARSYLLGMLYGTGNTIEWVPLWYLPHLFLAMLLALLILHISIRVGKERRIVVLNLLLLLAAGISVIHLFARMDVAQFVQLNRVVGNKNNNFPGLPWSLDLIGISAAFILFGYVWQKQVMQFQFHPWLFTVALAGFTALHFFFDETIDLNMRLYGNWWISTLQALLGTYLTLSISCLLQRYGKLGKVVAYLGMNSLFIMIFHSWIESKIFTLLSRWSAHAYLNACLALLAGILLPLVLLGVVRKYKIFSDLLLPKKGLPTPVKQ